MFDIAAIGEALIDFTPSGKNGMGISLYAQNPGGAPANVLAAAAKLGCKTAFIGKVGNDFFGTFLRKTLSDLNIDTGGMLIDRDAPTTLAFVALDETGNRSFCFYRNPGADIMITTDEIPRDLKCKIFHFGSVSMTAEPARSATVSAVKAAKAAGALISYDPNYRKPLWRSESEAVETMRSVLGYADILKISEEELVLLTGEEDCFAGGLKLEQTGIQLVMITLGEKGAFFRFRGKEALLPAYDVKTVDTTGAGDAFMGAVLSRICLDFGASLENLTAEDVYGIIDFANAAGSLATAMYGAIPAMPGYSEIIGCMGGGKWLF